MSGLNTTDCAAVCRVHALGSTAELVLTDPSALVAAAAILRTELDHIDRVASRFRADSEISKLYRDTNEVAVVSPKLFGLLLVALEMAEATDGAVDPTVGGALCRLGYDRDFLETAGGVDGQLPAPTPVPSWKSVEVDAIQRTVRVPAGTRIDLGAIAKAWAADWVAEAVFGSLGCGVLVSLGGDVAVAGTLPHGGFRIGLGDVCGGVARYYLGAPAYRRKGPPPVVLRLLGPILVTLTMIVFASGIALLLTLASWHARMLFVHKASFILWIAAMAVHVLGHLLDTAKLAPRDWMHKTRTQVRGAGLRQWSIAASLSLGLILAFITIPEVGRWLAAGGSHHG